MTSEELNQREAYFKELGQIVTRRHGQNVQAAAHNRAGLSGQEAAVRFGRYLRAARTNAGFSLAQLAAQAKISKATLTALEQGLYSACDIRSKWLKKLAGELDMDVDDLYCLLGRNMPTGNSGRFTQWLNTRWPGWKLLPKSPLVSRPVYATCSAIFLGLTLTTFLWLGFVVSDESPSPRVTDSYVIVGPERRLNIVKAEVGLENQIFIPPSRPNKGGSCCTQ